MVLKMLSCKPRDENINKIIEKHILFALPNYSRTAKRLSRDTVYPKKYTHGFCFAVLCCGYTLTDFPISIRLTSLALWQSNDCPSASKATLMNMDKYFMWIHYERLHSHNKAKHHKTVCIFLGIYCTKCADGGPNIIDYQCNLHTKLVNAPELVTQSGHLISSTIYNMGYANCNETSPVFWGNYATAC